MLFSLKQTILLLSYTCIRIMILYTYRHCRERYREISRVHCRVLLRVRSTSNNARGNERVMFPWYRSLQ